MQHSISISAMRYRMLLSLWFFSVNAAAALAAPTAPESTLLASRDGEDDAAGGGGGMKSHIIVPLVVIPVVAVLTVVSCTVYIWRRASTNKARRQSTVRLNARPQSGLSASTGATAGPGVESRPDSVALVMDAKGHSRRQSDAVLAVDLSKAFGEAPAAAARKKTRESPAPLAALPPMVEQ